MRNYFADERNFACVDGDGRHAYADEQRAVALDALGIAPNINAVFVKTYGFAERYAQLAVPYVIERRERRKVYAAHEIAVALSSGAPSEVATSDKPAFSSSAGEVA